MSARLVSGRCQTFPHTLLPVRKMDSEGSVKDIYIPSKKMHRSNNYSDKMLEG